MDPPLLFLFGIKTESLNFRQSLSGRKRGDNTGQRIDGLVVRANLAGCGIRILNVRADSDNENSSENQDNCDNENHFDKREAFSHVHLLLYSVNR